jgi:hypothetical protein
MTADKIVVALIVLTAVAFIARRVLASVRSARQSKAGCATDCGCGSESARGSHWAKT